MFRLVGLPTATGYVYISPDHVTAVVGVTEHKCRVFIEGDQKSGVDVFRNTKSVLEHLQVGLHAELIHKLEEPADAPAAP